MWTSLAYRLLLRILVDLLAGLAVGGGESEDQESTDHLWAEAGSVSTSAPIHGCDRGVP